MDLESSVKRLEYVRLQAKLAKLERRVERSKRLVDNLNIDQHRRTMDSINTCDYMKRFAEETSQLAKLVELAEDQPQILQSIAQRMDSWKRVMEPLNQLIEDELKSTVRRETTPACRDG